ncbi:MAG: hypothetical protein IT423_05000 [Pirellulaceae bacterium]|nr:hypothetical protein [Pirellulaceae bacterium]
MLAEISDPHDCGLVQLHECLLQLANIQPFSDLRAAVQAARLAGLTLRRCLPHLPQDLQETWLGARWILLHHQHYAQADTWASIVSSRIRKSDRSWACWPQWLASALQSIGRHRQTCLLLPETTTAPWLSAVLPWLPSPHLRVDVKVSERRAGPAMNQVGTWLADQLQRVMAQPLALRDVASLSPAFAPAEDQFEELPLQDRLAVCWAHRVIAISIRANGNLENLILQRMRDSTFAAGTVMVAMSAHQAKRNIHWLDQGAVGWYVDSNSQVLGLEREFACQRRGNTPLVQLTAPYRMWPSNPKQLVHCVRGNSGTAARQATHETLLDQFWHAEIFQDTPLHTLLKIIRTRRLRSSARFFRAGVPAVSFSELPVQTLMARRTFQSHLGRWDWEPYGLLIRLEALSQLGARPVLYGDDKLYERLEADRRAFYQPANRRTAKTDRAHWIHECEWRWLGDLSLDELPAGQVLLFVPSASEAIAVAQYSPWPVTWLNDVQNQPLPNGSVHQRRKAIQTSRN